MFEYTRLFLLVEVLFSSFGLLGAQSEDRFPYNVTCVESVGKCYVVIYEGHTWASAFDICQQFLSAHHLAAITSEPENTELKKFLKSEIETRPPADTAACIPTNRTDHGIMFWTSGQRQIENNCKTPFVWKQPSDMNQSFGFTNWARGQPNCDSNKESCVLFWAIQGLTWNDIRCDIKVCPLCEYTMPPAT